STDKILNGLNSLEHQILFSLNLASVCSILSPSAEIAVASSFFAGFSVLRSIGQRKFRPTHFPLFLTVRTDFSPGIFAASSTRSFCISRSSLNENMKCQHPRLSAGRSEADESRGALFPTS